jgi:hypothetical protein
VGQPKLVNAMSDVVLANLAASAVIVSLIAASP